MSKAGHKLDGYINSETGEFYYPGEIHPVWTLSTKTSEIPVGYGKLSGRKTIIIPSVVELPFNRSKYHEIFYILSKHLSQGLNAIYITHHKDNTYTYAETHQDLASICKCDRTTITKFLKEADKLCVVKPFGKVDTLWFINPTYAYNGKFLPIEILKAFNIRGKKLQKGEPIILRECTFHYEGKKQSGSWPGKVEWDGTVNYKDERVYFNISPIVGDSINIEIIINNKGCCNTTPSGKKFYKLNQSIFDELYNSIIRS